MIVWSSVVFRQSAWRSGMHVWVYLSATENRGVNTFHAWFQSCAWTRPCLGLLNSALVLLHPFAAFTSPSFMHVESENM
jgi:hypothetical protein